MVVQVIYIVQEIRINWDILEELMYQINRNVTTFEEAELGILEPSY